MAKRLQHRGGTTSQHSTFTGAVREVTVDTDKNTLVVHDGATAGGHPLATATNFTSTGIDDNATSTAITINSDGQVGIGITPNLSGKRLYIDSTGFCGVELSESGTRTGAFGYDPVNNWLSVGTSQAEPLRFFTNSTERMRITSGGQVLVAGTNAGDSVSEIIVDNGSATSTYGFRHQGAGKYLRMGCPNNAFAYFETNAIAGFNFNSDTNIKGSLQVDVSNSGVTPNVNADELFVENSGNAGITIGSGTSHAGQLCFGDSDDNDRGAIAYLHDVDAMRFTVSNAEKMRIDSSGSVGIGTTSPFNTRPGSFTVSNEAPTIYLEDTNGSGFQVGQILYQNAALTYTTGSRNGTGTTNSTEHFRINSSGQTLIGTTVAPGNADTKLMVHVPIASSSRNVIEMSHNTNGANKPGAALGLVINNGGESTNAASLTFHTASGGSLSRRMTINNSGAMLLGTTTAGSASAGDLVVNGGAFLGGTGTANKLDDYEEGTWTPTLNSGTASTFYATYTKIGNQCTLHFYLFNFSDTTSSIDIVISGLPFTQDTVGTTVVGVGSAYGERFDFNARTVVISGQDIRIRDGLGVLNFSDSLQYVDNNNGSDSALVGTVTYQTT